MNFLALTSADQYWDIDYEAILYLGEWCKTFHKEEEINQNITTLPYIWDSNEKMSLAVAKTDLIYNRVFTILYRRLNQIHSLDKNEDFWNTLLMPWLLPYVQVIYDRYSHLREAKENYVGVYTITMSEDCYLTPSTPSELSSSTQIDLFNQQIFSQILSYTQMIPFERRGTLRKNKFRYINMKSNFKNKILSFISSTMNRLLASEFILVSSPYFKTNKLISYLRIMICSKFKFVFDDLLVDFSSDAVPDLKLREDLACKVENEFDSLVLFTLKYNFPILLLEGFKEFSEKVNKEITYDPSIIYSANSLHWNDTFRYFVAKRKKDSRLYYAQHGGNYGIDEFNIPEKIERTLADNFITTGWSDGDIKLKKGFSIDLNLKQMKFKKKKEIYYIMTSFPKYLYRFDLSEVSSRMIEYLDFSLSFLRSMNSSLPVTIRPYHIDFGWNLCERIKKSGINFKVNNSEDYYQQLSKAKLIIFDHMHTGYLESLSQNIPTIIVLSMKFCNHRKELSEKVKLLRKSKILFNNIKDANEHLDNIAEDPEQWWNSVEVQESKDNFLKSYYKKSNHWIADWEKLFN